MTNFEKFIVLSDIDNVSNSLAALYITSSEYDITKYEIHAYTDDMLSYLKRDKSYVCVKATKRNIEMLRLHDSFIEMPEHNMMFHTRAFFYLKYLYSDVK